MVAHMEIEILTAFNLVTFPRLVKKGLFLLRRVGIVWWQSVFRQDGEMLQG